MSHPMSDETRERLKVAESERDELLRQVKEGDELRQEYLDDWQKEVAELQRQLDSMTKWRQHYVTVWERAEAQAARYRDALARVCDDAYSGGSLWCRSIAEKALREPETGSSERLPTKAVSLTPEYSCNQCGKKC